MHRLSRPATVLLVVYLALAVQGGVSLTLRLVDAGPDVVHPLVHLVSGLLGAATVLRHRGLVAFGTGFGAAYTLLAVAGASGLVTVPWLPLGAADHVFHVVLGPVVLATALAANRQRTAQLSRQP